MGMSEKAAEAKERDKREAVRAILKKQGPPLSIKQEKYCNDACVARFLTARGDNVKKAAKHLRAVLSWRDAVGTDHLIADEFSAELADGVAYVAGHDDEARPVVVFRIKQDYPKFHTQKSFVRLLVFTLEVAVSSMSRFVDQFVLIFDASFFRSASAFLNMLMGTLKIVAEYYPGRLHRAFVVDPPSLFSVLWKGVRAFVELAPATAVVSSLDFDDPLEVAGGGAGGFEFAACARAASLRFEPSAAAKAVGSASSRFSFTVSHLNSLKPWYLSTATPGDGSGAAVPASSPSLIGASPLSARSFSFASPVGRSSVPSTPAKPAAPAAQPRTPRPSFLQSPSLLFGFRTPAAAPASRGERDREAFVPFLKFFRRPYDEMVYRAKMRPPLGGLTSIVASAHIKHHHQHFHQLPPTPVPSAAAAAGQSQRRHLGGGSGQQRI